MTDIRKLLAQIASEEAALHETQFLAPCVQGGQVRTKVGGLVHAFTPHPRDFEGWGLFRPLDDHTAEVVEEASLPLVAEYLKLFTALRLRLVRALQGQTWLTYPMNESDARQRTGEARPVPVHLVTEGAAFEPIVARWDGGAWWFDEIDRRADPRVADRLRDAQRQLTPPESLRFPGITPETRTTYDLVVQREIAMRAAMERQRREAEEAQQRATAEGRLRHALDMAGGELNQYRDRGDYWTVEWTTRDGQRHTSAIAKRDLTVISSGICLSGRDRDFDLQSLVGVIQRRT